MYILTVCLGYKVKLKKEKTRGKTFFIFYLFFYNYVDFGSHIFVTFNSFKPIIILDHVVIPLIEKANVVNEMHKLHI